VRSPTLAARRIGQTVRTFDNGWSVLAKLATRRGGDDALDFHLRGGGRIECPNYPGARVPVYEVFAEDAYRIDELTAGLRDDLVALDIGAHIGCFSVALARAVPGARVHSYEASPSTAAWLERNVAANALGSRVSAHASAVSDRVGTISFADNAHGSSLNGLTAPSGATKVDVPCVPIRDAFAAAGDHVDIVKIDTEGAEYTMVLGSDPADWAGVSRVVLEYHDVAGHDRDELVGFFAGAGLEVVDEERASDRQGVLWLARGA
jgi:FkbM family methyltransferase